MKKTLAGVPFLLRNILTLHRAGIEKLVLWLQGHDKEPLHHQIAQDFFNVYSGFSNNTAPLV
jgi:hypothetical protein